MSIIAAQPRLILNDNITIKSLAKECEKQLKMNQHLELGLRTNIVNDLSRRFTFIEDQRKVGFCKQVSLLFKRNMSIALRNPLQLAAVVILGVAQSFMLVVLYHGCGGKTPT